MTGAKVPHFAQKHFTGLVIIFGARSQNADSESNVMSMYLNWKRKEQKRLSYMCWFLKGPWTSWTNFPLFRLALAQYVSTEDLDTFG